MYTITIDKFPKWIINYEANYREDTKWEGRYWSATNKEENIFAKGKDGWDTIRTFEEVMAFIEEQENREAIKTNALLKLTEKEKRVLGLI